MFRNGVQVGVSSLQVTQNPGGFVGNVYAPVNTNVETAIWLSSFMDLPGDTSILDAAVFALEEADINDRADVTGDVAAHDLEIGRSASIDGDALSEEQMLIRDGGSVTGKVESYGGFDLQDLPGTIGSIELTPATLPFGDVMNCAADFDTLNFTGPVGWTNYELQGADQRLDIDLLPGQYGSVRAKRDVHLYLSPGTYYFRDLDIGQGAVIHTQGEAPIYIYIDGFLDFKGSGPTYDPANSDFAQIQIGVVSDKPVHIQHPNEDIPGFDLMARIFAPNSTVEIHNEVKFWGQIIANRVEVHQDTEVVFRPFAGGQFCFVP